MIPNYQITGQSVTPQEIVDIIPEQEKQDQQIQSSEERYLRQLEKNSADRIRNTEKMYEGLATLSSSVADLVKKKQEKHRADRLSLIHI